MRFALADEQEDLRALARRFFDTEFPIETVRRVMESATGSDPSSWARLAEVGFTGLAIGEEYGGAGASAVEVAVLLREAGRALVPAPLLPAAVAAAALTAAGGASAAEWLPRIAAGQAVATLATADARGSAELDGTGTDAHPVGGGWALTGAKGYVVAGASADLLLVTATIDSGVALFAVRGDAPGVLRTAVPALDPTRSLAEIGLVEAPAARLSLDRVGIETLLQTAAVWLAGEQVGGAERCLETATEYAKSRVQFGRPIGSFQAIKHLLADTSVAMEASNAMAAAAIHAVALGHADAGQVVSMAKAFIGDAARQLANACWQTYGGIAYTWQHDFHLYLRRLTADASLYGDPTWHRERLCRLHGL
jgi:alkylation response protein AidB-like acyl-CoA dehydrogenase